MSLRVAHVTATFPPYQGGTGNVCFHHARELVQRGHETHVFTTATPDAAGSSTVDGITVRRLKPWAQVGNASLLPGLFQALAGFDIIHLHYPFISGAEIARAAAQRWGTPLVISFHNDLIGDGFRAPVFSLYQWLSAGVTVRSAARLCAVSLDHYHSSRLRRVLSDGKPPVVALPNGVDTVHFCPLGTDVRVRRRYGIPDDAKVVLFVAALDRAHHFKGLSTLLRAVQTLPPDVWLLVVGDGDLRVAYEQEAAALGIAQRTVFAGAIPHGDTPSFYRAASVKALPSLPPESFGLVLIEALACGTPVVAGNIPGVRTVVNHGQDGLLVEPGNVRELAQAIQTIVSNEAARWAMGQAGRAKVEELYDWRQIGTRLESIYHDVIASQR